MTITNMMKEGTVTLLLFGAFMTTLFGVIKSVLTNWSKLMTQVRKISAASKKAKTTQQEVSSTPPNAESKPKKGPDWLMAVALFCAALWFGSSFLNKSSSPITSWDIAYISFKACWLFSLLGLYVLGKFTDSLFELLREFAMAIDVLESQEQLREKK